MPEVKNILDYLSELAPIALKMDFDNVGLLVGSPSSKVTRILTALDATDEVIAEAARMKAELIVAHHPMFFELKSVTDADTTGRKILALAASGISAICMHTNLDAAVGGVNDSLAAALGLRVDGELNEEQHVSRLCSYADQRPFGDFLDRVYTSLGVNGLRYHDAGRPVRVVGVCGGSGGQDIELAYERGCDTYLTADVKHHQFILARELGMNLVDAGHFPTENVVVPVIAGKLAARFPDISVSVSAVCAQTERFFVR